MPVHDAPIERKWFAVAPDGAECEVLMQVGVPMREPSGDWIVMVNLAGLEHAAYKIFGIDSWQATALGMKFIASRVGDFSERGWKFFWERGGECASSEDLGFDS
jgi:hypothetical protein